MVYPGDFFRKIAFLIFQLLLLFFLFYTKESKELGKEFQNICIFDGFYVLWNNRKTLKHIYLEYNIY